MVKRAFSTKQLLRYPLVFGGCLAAYFTAFSFRKIYFHDEIEEAKAKIMEQDRLAAEKLAAAKEELRRERAQKQVTK